jgi:hypothetical protein
MLVFGKDHAQMNKSKGGAEAALGAPPFPKPDRRILQHATRGALRRRSHHSQIGLNERDS